MTFFPEILSILKNENSFKLLNLSSLNNDLKIIAERLKK